MTHLLDLVLVQVPAPVLRTRFGETARVLTEAVDAARRDDNVRECKEERGRRALPLPHPFPSHAYTLTHAHAPGLLTNNAHSRPPCATLPPAWPPC